MKIDAMSRIENREKVSTESKRVLNEVLRAFVGNGESETKARFQECDHREGRGCSRQSNGCGMAIGAATIPFFEKIPAKSQKNRVPCRGVDKKGAGFPGKIDALTRNTTPGESASL